MGRREGVGRREELKNNGGQQPDVKQGVSDNGEWVKQKHSAKMWHIINKAESDGSHQRKEVEIWKKG